jgi:linoleoyl-CoA desaturase
VAASAIGFSIFHDANHGTLFRRGKTNLWFARLCSVVLGPSRHFWVHKHQGLHHRLPNVIEWDDDLETRGMLRLSPETPWQPRFRRQEVKAILYYGLNSLEWLFLKDFKVLATGRMNEWQKSPLTKEERTELLVSKAVYFALFVVPVFVVLPLAWAVTSFLLFHLVQSWLLAAVFQVSHLTREMEFGGVRPGDDWAMHQLRTTADYATDSLFMTWFSGGLNHQVEHHLFPNVAHSHYQALRPIVCEVAKRHGLPCHDLGSAPSAIRKHLSYLKTLGLEPQRSHAGALPGRA